LYIFNDMMYAQWKNSNIWTDSLLTSLRQPSSYSSWQPCIVILEVLFRISARIQSTGAEAFLTSWENCCGSALQ